MIQITNQKSLFAFINNKNKIAEIASLFFRYKSYLKHLRKHKALLRINNTFKLIKFYKGN